MKPSIVIGLVLVWVGAAFAQHSDSAEAFVLRESGRLETSDESRDGHSQDTYVLNAPGTGLLEIVAVSPDFNPTLRVESESGAVRVTDGSANAVRTVVRVSAGDVVSVDVIGSLSSVPGGYAPYLITVRFLEAGGSLAVGGMIRGSLDYDDEVRADGSYVDWYDVELPPDARVRVDLSSPDLDTYLLIELPDGRMIENDDSNGTDSSLSFPTGSGGTARVGASSYNSGALGAYTVEMSSVQVRTISVGQTVEADLTGPEDTYILTGTPGETVQIDLRADSFDTFLELSDAYDTYLSNDDAEDYNSSRIVYAIAADGEATVTVSSYSEGGGRYVLEVRPYRYDGPHIADGYRLSDSESIEGALGPHVPMRNGSYSQRFSFSADRGERVEVVLRSEAFDSYLTVIAPDGREHTDDDSAGGLDARVVLTTDQSGVYDVYASDLGGGSIGRYTLSFARLGSSRTVLDLAGELTRSDLRDITGKFYDTHRFRVSAGRLVTIDVVSEDFDGYAIVRSSSGEVLYRDDDSGGSSNPRITFTAERSETLELVVTTYSHDETGAYRVGIYE